jgi:K+-transporting ATPase KdpF subunit
MSRPVSGCESVMTEPLLGLIVAILVGVYLVATLLYPERF